MTQSQAIKELRKGNDVVLCFETYHGFLGKAKRERLIQAEYYGPAEREVSVKHKIKAELMNNEPHTRKSFRLLTPEDDVEKMCEI